MKAQSVVSADSDWYNVATIYVNDESHGIEVKIRFFTEPSESEWEKLHKRLETAVNEFLEEQ